MKTFFWRNKILFLIIFIFSGVLLFVDDASAQTYVCTCANSNVTGPTTFTTVPTPYTSANDYCDAYCAAAGGVGSLITQNETCSYCCCNNGSFDSGNQQIDCSSYCSASEGVQSSGSYNCNQAPAVNCQAVECVNTLDCAEDYICENGQCVLPGGGGGGGGGDTGGDNASDMMPGAPIGGTRIPNWFPSSDISALILNVVNFLINYIALPFAIFMIILAGFRFATAQGNEEKLKKARQNFMWTVIGVAVVLAARIIVTYIQELLGNTSGGALNAFINRIRGTLNVVIGMLFALVTVYFIWGVIQYVRSGGDEEQLKQGKRHMVWGIVGMAIMGAAYGIVNLIRQYIGA